MLEKKPKKMLLMKIDEDIHAEIKARAALRKITMAKYVLRALAAMIEKEKKYE